MPPEGRAPLIVDRYAIFDRIAAGGMATVHLGRLLGKGGFSRTVAIKRLHAQYALDPDFVGMFLDEARLAARIRHPNVVPTLDVVARGDEVFLVMEYIEGEPLSALLRAAQERGERVPPGHVSTLITGVLEGLHAAHEARDDQGSPLHIVHRDISPHNVLVGVDGIPRVIDFGVAKALNQVHTTQEGHIRGKLAYMSPEQVRGATVDSRTDIFAASAVLWEALTGRKLFKAENDAALMRLLLSGTINPPSVHAPELPKEVDAVVMKGLERDANRRYATADEMAAALSEALPGSPARKVGAWVKELGGQKLDVRATTVREIEKLSSPSAQVMVGEHDVAPGSIPSGAIALPTLGTHPTQASAGSMVTPSEEAPLTPSKLRVWPIALGAAGGLVVVLAAVVLFPSRRAPPREESVFVASTPPASASAAPPTAAPPTAPDVAASAAPDVAGAETSAVAPRPPATASATVDAGKPAHETAASKVPSRPSPRPAHPAAHPLFSRF